MNQSFHPLVSIIIPVYNGSNFVGQAIDSALAQTYDNIEIIIVNDGSKDDGATEAIALQYGDKIRYFRKANGGVSSALNFGIDKMRGEYFSWLSHDDLYEPTKVEREVDALAKLDAPKKSIVVCADTLIDKDGKEIFHPVQRLNGVFAGKDVFDVFFTRHIVINGCTLLIPKSAFSDFGGFGKFRYIQDIERWITFMLGDITFCFLPDKLVKMRVHPGQVTQRMPELYFVEMAEFSSSIIDNYIAQGKLSDSNLKSFLCFQYKNRNKSIYQRIEQITGYSSSIKKFGYILYGILFDCTRSLYKKFIKR